MKRIVWQPESKILIDSFKNRTISSECRGGHIYEYHAADVLSRYFNVSMDEGAPRNFGESSLNYWKRLHRNTIDGDVFILAPPIISHGKRRKSGPEIGMLHHIYLSQKKRSLKGKISLEVLKHRLRGLDVVVTVSKYWADYLDKIGCKDIRVIYNAFNSKEFNFSDKEIKGFLKKYHINKRKPIIYIGYADVVKGIGEVSEVLDDREFSLIMTGPDSSKHDIPVKCFFLNRKDYLLLLSVCDVVVNMSKIEEGWSRVAHEALLCQTPVIGSGKGGMKELLEGGGQEVCNDIAKLPERVREVIANKDSYVSRGYKFAESFTYEAFSHQWISLLNEVT